MPGGASTLGADISIDALQSGAIGAAPLHPFLSAPSLLPGRSADGSVTLRNQTGVPLWVRLRALPSAPDLNGLLRVRLASGPLGLYDGALDRLRADGARPFRLAPTERRTVSVRVWLPRGLRSGYQGRIVDITLELASGRTP